MQEKDMSGEMWEKISKKIFSSDYSCLGDHCKKTQSLKNLLCLKHFPREIFFGLSTTTMLLLIHLSLS